MILNKKMLNNYQNLKISVVIICYNQENLISRAINSVIYQKDYLYELIISDDHSTDNTWNIILNYQKNFPEIIKPYRNLMNLGIYGNLQSTYEKITGNFIFFLSGDDELGENLLKSTFEFFKNMNLDFENEKFCIITNWKQIDPNYKERLHYSNKLILKYNPFGLKLRGLIFNRILGISKGILKNLIYTLPEINKDENLKYNYVFQEGFNDNFPFYVADSVFYLNIIGNIYYSKIGFSKNILNNKKDLYLKLIEWCEKAPLYFKHLSENDKNWLMYNKAKYKFLLTPNFNNMYFFFIHFLKLFKDPLFKFIFMKEIKIFLKFFKISFLQKLKIY